MKSDNICVKLIHFRGCNFDGACGGVIVTSGAKASMMKCSFENTNRIGVEIRDRAFATVTKCEIANSGLQAVVVHADGLGFVLKE